MRLVDSRWSSGVTVVGFESSLIRSLDHELSVPQIELIYLSEDRHARLYQYLACDTLYIQPSSLVVYEAKIHYDAGTYPRPEATW